MPEFWSSICIFGWGWAHGTDLIGKWVLPNTSLIVEYGDIVPQHITHCTIATPIWVTRALIDRVMVDNLSVQIINFAGLMGPTLPDDKRASVGSFHALWWPRTHQDFRIVHATDGVDDALSHYLLKRVLDQGMTIIKRTRNQHDKQMALHQALTHAAIILHDSAPWVAKISPPTSPQTIADMMLYNPFFLEVWGQFCGYIEFGKWLGESYRLCMNEAHPDLSTPNSARQLDASMMWTFSPDTVLMNQLSAWLLEVKNAELVSIITASRNS